MGNHPKVHLITPVIHNQYNKRVASLEDVQ